MKLPFANFIGPPLKRYWKFYGRVCVPRVFGYDIYVICFGILGAIVSMMDVINIMKGGPTLSESLWRMRCKRSCSILSAEMQRDLKLVVSMLNFEHYLYLIAGALTENPALLMPWLFMAIVVIMLETFLFISRLIADGIYMNRYQIVIAAIMTHNWLQVFCYFKSLILSKCDI